MLGQFDAEVFSQHKSEVCKYAQVELYCMCKGVIQMKKEVVHKVWC